MEEIDLKIRTPFSCVVSAVSSGGKSTFIVDFLLSSDKIVDKKFSKIIVVSSHFQKSFEQLRRKFDLVYADTLQEAETHFQPECCLVVDDRLDEINSPGESNRFISELFCRRCHHESINVIVAVQVLFPQYMRTIFNNATYLVIGKWIKNKSSITTFAKQFSPLNYKYFLEAYTNATRNPYGFLVIDLHMLTNDRFRLRNGFNPNNRAFEIYIESNAKST